MILEIIVVLLGVNIIVGGYNNRNMLIEPYQNILNKTSWYMISDKNISIEEPILGDMQGDLHEIRMGNYFDDIMTDSRNISIRIKICPDEIIRTFRQMENKFQERYNLHISN